MVWARILLLFGCFASGPPKALDARDLAASSVLEALCCFCCWRLLPLVHSVGNVSAFFLVAFRHFFWLLFRMVWARILLLFGCFASGPPKALDARDLAASSVLEALCCFCCWRLLPLVTNFSAFRRQRFGIFSGCCFAWFGHESCCCSAVSQAVRQRLWTLETLPRRAFWKRCAVFAVGDFSVVLFLLLVHSVGNVSAFFLVAVSHGLGTNPAAVRLFRKRSAKGFGR